MQKINFSVDASIIERLGRELVSKKETALSELVKNAYDADATEVNLIFKNAETEGGTLIIEDNGTGMTEDELINGFLRIASTTKVREPFSKKYKRKRAGKKGIGRFAVHRLGKKLTLITQTKESDKALKLEIDWDEFIQGKRLEEINAVIKEIPKEKEKGTTLIIENLRDKWTENDIKTAYRYLRDVLQPFPLSKSAENLNLDPGFKVKCYKENKSEENLIVDEEKTFFEHALAELDAYVDENGYIHYEINSRKLNFREEGVLPKDEETREGYKYLENKVYLKAYYFLYETSLLPKGMLTFIRDIARKEGGIRVYKNGFRVLPYGESDDDWLGLDESVRRRLILTPHGNNNFFGFIEIVDTYDEFFQEKADREGFIENEAFKELQDFGYKIITYLAVRIANKRKRKAKTSDKNWKPKLERTKEKVKELESKVKDIELKEEVKEITENIEEVEKEFEAQEKKFLSEIGFLRVLASMGLSIGEFVHEVKHMINNITSIEKKIQSLSVESENLKDLLHTLHESLRALKTYISYFDKSIAETVSKQLNPLNLRALINEFIKTINLSERYKHLEIETEFDGLVIMTEPMHKTELISILMNLFTNSVKAIKRAGRDKGKIKIKAGVENKNVYIEFSDNGDGIPKELREKIFEEFFTTSIPKGKYEPDYKELTGMGLGLKIIKDIVESYNGKIFVKDVPENGFITTFRIELPKGELKYGKYGKN